MEKPPSIIRKIYSLSPHVLQSILLILKTDHNIIPKLTNNGPLQVMSAIRPNSPCLQTVQLNNFAIALK